MTENQNPEGFRQFLSSGSSLFLELGERIGRLEQIVSFWEYRLSHHHDGGMAPDDVMDALRDLMQGLSIWPTFAPKPFDDTAAGRPRRAGARPAAPPWPAERAAPATAASSATARLIVGPASLCRPRGFADAKRIHDMCLAFPLAWPRESTQPSP